ncbi:hypothetical protein ACOMHN_055036 [Nucella lapillus]
MHPRFDAAHWVMQLVKHLLSSSGSQRSGMFLVLLSEDEFLCFTSKGLSDFLDKEINARICKTSQALGRLWARVLNQHNIQLSTKLKV